VHRDHSGSRGAPLFEYGSVSQQEGITVTSFIKNWMLYKVFIVSNWSVWEMAWFMYL